MRIKETLVFASEWLGMRCDDALQGKWMPQKDQTLPRSMYVFVVLAAFLIALSGVLLNDLPLRDVAQRYAPMADAFAAGNFDYAFHPRVPMLHPLLAGCVSFLTGCGGFTAAKIVSMLFFALTVVPLMALMRRVYGMNIAVGTGYVYLIAAPLIRLSFSGLREMEKCFLILLAAYALVRIFQERGRLTGYLWAGVAAGLAVLTRVDLILYGALIVLCAIRLEAGTGKFPLRSLITCATALLLTLPACVMNWKSVGAVVPDGHLADLLPVTWPVFSAGIVFALVSTYAFCMIWVRIPAKIRIWIVAGALCAGACVLFAVSIRLGLFSDPEEGYKYIKSIWNGAFSYLGICGLIGITVRLFQRRWQKEETLLLLLGILHAMTILGIILLLEKKLYVSARYLLPALPLSFGWVAIGFVVPLYYLEMLFCLLPHGQRLFRAIRFAMYLGFALGTWYYCFAPLIPCCLSERKQTEREAIMDFSRMIREREAMRQTPRTSAPPRFRRSEYRPGLPLRIGFLEKADGKWKKSSEKLLVIAYFARARVSAAREPSDYIVTMRSPGEAGIAVKRAHLLGRKEGKSHIYELWSLEK